MSDKPRQIRWEDLQAFYEMQMQGKNPAMDFQVKEHDRKIRSEMQNELARIIWDVEKGRGNEVD